MDSESELRAQVAQLKRANEQLGRTNEQLDRTNEQLGRANEQLGRANEQLGRANEQLGRTNKRLERTNERLEQLQQQTTFSEYLEKCHRELFQQFAIRPDASGTTVTKVDSKFYPFSLRPWTEFAELQQQQLDFIKSVLKDDRIFPSQNGINEMQRRACEAPVANENDIRPFEHIAVEGPVTDIIRALCTKAETNPSVAGLGVSRISFTNHSLGVRLLPEGVFPGDTSEYTETQRHDPSPMKHVAVEPKDINPDRRCLREDPRGNCTIAFVVEYKAAHKLPANQVRRGLNEHLFANVIKRHMSSKSSTDETQAAEARFDKILAMALTQTFDYMIKLGLEYSYLTTGKLFLFLRVKADNPKTLYYHFIDPDEEAEDENGQFRESKTAVAQVVGFSLLALRSETRSQSWTAKAQAVLYDWPIPYPETELETSTDEELSPSPFNSSDLSFEAVVDLSPRKRVLRSKSACKVPNTDHGRKDDADDGDDSNGPSSHPLRGPSSTDFQTKQKHARSSGTGSSSFEKTSSTKEQSREYCTMGCLMGLKQGQKLDANCPNVASHRIATESTTHPINIDDLAGLMQEQLSCSLDRDCEPLEMEGKYGAIGTLFKLSLRQYGYTFVGKGTIPDFVPILANEAKIYDRLEVLQGEVVPIYLGSISLTKPYHLTARNAIRFAGFKIVRMLLMSWAGELAMKVGKSVDLAAETARSVRMLGSVGVIHHDVREANLLWNEECGRVMVIDFDHADLVPPAKPRQLERILKRKRRWTGGQIKTLERKCISSRIICERDSGEKGGN